LILFSAELKILTKASKPKLALEEVETTDVFEARVELETLSVGGLEVDPLVLDAVLALPFEGA